MKTILKWKKKLVVSKTVVTVLIVQVRNCEGLDYDNVSTHLRKGTDMRKIAKAKSNGLDNYLDVRK